MKTRCIFWVLVVGSLGLWLAGCAAGPTPQRPQAGDRVVPQIQLDSKPWRAGELVTLVVVLQVQGPNEANPSFLQVDDVPKDAVPSITLQFFKGDQLLETVADVPLVRDC